MSASDQRYTLTSLTEPDAVVLEVEGVRFAVVQFNASFSVNDVPTAIVILGIGRQGQRRADTPATVHQQLRLLRQMKPARVWLTLRGEVVPGINWTEGRQCIFDGYVAGVGYRKMGGTIQVTVRLVHWLIDLSCSSMLSSALFAQNVGSVNARAVLNLLSGTGAEMPASVAGYVSGAAVGGSLIPTLLQQDLWTAVKKLMYEIAQRPVLPAGPALNCITFTASNNRALRSLVRIESLDGAGVPFTLPAPFDQYSQLRYAAPLSLLNNPSTVIEAVQFAIGSELLSSYANQTFWEKLIGQLFPMFGMVLIPTIDRALVAADLPGYNQGVWKTLDAVSVDMNDALEYPIRGVGVVLPAENTTGAGITELGAAGEVIGGCYAVDGIDGVLRVVSGPEWLSFTAPATNNPARSRGLDQNQPERSADSDTSGKPPVRFQANVSELLNDFCRRYARLYFVNSYLRGRNGSAAGKLRFDVAPGSIVRILHSGERFLRKDALEAALIGCVSRVTVTLSAESKVATTAFDLVAVRTDHENSSATHGLDEHPLFGKSIHGGGKYGAPLLPAYDLEPSDTES